MSTQPKLIRPLVPIEQWIEDPFFVGPEVSYIRPYVKRFLIDFANGRKRKFICTGAARTGKSYGVRLLVQRILYEASCWENFPCLFGLSPSTFPKIYWLSYTMSKAESTGLKQLIKMIDKVPYWQLPELKRKPLESELEFPFMKISSGSNVSHIIGEDTLGCVLDEANVRKVASGTEVEEAQRMFTEMRQRSVMTFSRNGIWGGFSGIISSSTTSSSFVYQELQKAKEKNDTVIMEASVYEANPEQFSKETFDVYLGDSDIPPFIVDKADSTITGQINNTYGLTLDNFIKEHSDNIEKVPVSIREFYEEDLIFSLANMSGKVQAGGSNFMSIKTTDKIWDKSLKMPFPLGQKDIPEIGIYDPTSPQDIWNPDIALLHYHGENAYVHIDASQKHDKTGFSMLYWDKEDSIIRSLLTCSFFLNPSIADNQIDQEKILQLLIFMRDNGVNMKFLSGDHYAKDFIIPQVKRMWGNDHADYLSVDKDSVAYLTMLNFAKMGRYSIPYYAQLEYELTNLIYDRSTGKIDHPKNPNASKPIYFKDCSDAFAGATFHIYTREGRHYEDLMMEKEQEKIVIPDDGFFSSINHDEVEEDIDTFKEFTDGLMGNDIGYSFMDDLE